MTTGKTLVSRRQCYLLLAASVMTCLLITMGGIVCVTESGAGCPDWPGCYGRLVPPPQARPIIEYMHRFIAALTSPLIIAAAVVGWRKSRPVRWVSRPPAIAIPFLLAVIVFGAFAVLTGLPPALAAIDLGSALIVLALMLTATVAAFARHANPELPDRLTAGSSLARLSLPALLAVFLVYVGGILTAGKGSLTRCLGWPLWSMLPGDVPGWPQAVRLAIAGAAAVLLIAVVVRGWRGQPRGAAVRRVAALLCLAFITEMLVGGLMLAVGSSIGLLVIYAAAGAALWALLVVLAALALMVGAGTAEPVPQPGRRPGWPAGPKTART